MKKHKLFVAGMMLLALANLGRAEDIQPFSITLFGLYGEPVQPLGLAKLSADGFGLDLLGEWNASPSASLGLSYEQVTFYSNPVTFTVPSLNLEGRVFPLANGKGPYSPYVMGGAGFDLGNGAYRGPFVLQAALGTRVSIVPLLYLDIAAGSHWIQAPNASQYVDIRTGLSCSFDVGGSSSAKPTPSTTATVEGTQTPPGTPTPEATVMATQTATPAVTLTDTPTPVWTPEDTDTPTPEPTHVHWRVTATPTPTPTEVEENQDESLFEPTPTEAPETVQTVAESMMKKYYKKGVAAFEKRKYSTALADLKKALTYQDPHVAYYYYAEANATIGVIYHFHSDVSGHLKLAMKYYKRALRIDPYTKSARKYIKLLKAKPKPTPTETD